MVYKIEMKKDVILEIYKDIGTVYRFNDIVMLVGETNFQSLSKKLNKFVHLGKLLNPRKGIYAKSNYNPEELACILYTPSYISLEYVLQKAGVVFQYDSRITTISYMNMSLAEYLQKCIEQLESMSDKGLLNGLGELMENDMKKFVRTKLCTETIVLLKFYKDFPILS
jgi:hypothetical protein